MRAPAHAIDAAAAAITTYAANFAIAKRSSRAACRANRRTIKGEASPSPHAAPALS